MSGRCLQFLKKWISENFYNESLLAICGLGKYRLASGYTSFSVDPTLWSKWSDQRKEQHMKRFFEYVAKSSEIYQKSANAGKKR